MRRALLLTSLCASAVALAPVASASAAVAGQSSLDAETIVYSADPGEANRMTVSRDGERIVFADAGADIRPGSGCTGIEPRRVSCEVAKGEITSVELGDGDDEATTAGDIVDLTIVALDGGQGDDTLRGTSDPNSLTGGTGQNTLIGGSGTSSISGVVLRSAGSPLQMPDLAVHRDTISCAARSPSLPYRSIRIDANDAVTGDCGSDVSVYTSSVVVVRGTDGDDSLNGSYYPTNLYGLGGDDRFFGSGTQKARSDGGPGNDTFDIGGLLLGGPGDDVLRSRPAGSLAVRQDGGPGDDKLQGQNGGDRLVGGPGTDAIIAKSGNDYVNSRDGERDSVSCGDGHDRVVADRKDRVSRDCEKVSRR